MIGIVTINKLPRIGREIMTRLSYMGKTQTWLANNCGVTQQTISNTVRGKTVPTPLVAKKMAAALGYDDEAFLNLFID